MAVRFYIDPETSGPHIHQHGVSEDEVEEVLASPMEDRPGRDQSRVAIGRTRRGRFLRIIYILEGGGDIFVITAYPLTGKPLAAFKRRMKRRRRRGR